MKVPLLVAALIFACLVPYNVYSGTRSNFEAAASNATGAIFDPAGNFHCSGTEIGRAGPDGIFLTARHCIVDGQTHQVHRDALVSFNANEAGPFYVAHPIAISLTDDIALLDIVNGANIPTVAIADERALTVGEPLLNVSYPLNMGKLVFRGEYMAPRFPHVPNSLLQAFPEWQYSMPVNLTWAHGSSGSGVFSPRLRALVGVAVGTFGEGSFNIAIPGDRILLFLHDLKHNTVADYMQKFPEQPANLFENTYHPI